MLWRKQYISNKMYTDKEIIEDLNKAAQKKGSRILTQKDYKKHGNISLQTVINRFDKWSKAVYIAGLKPGN